MTKIRNIGVLTSGGDAPGMNACIRAVVRQGIAEGMKVFGIRDGFNGLIDDDIELMTYQSVSNIIQRGGTILGTARSPRFLLPNQRQVAFNNLQGKNIDALVVIGGDGSYRGAQEFYNEFGLPYVGIPATIDNDMEGTEYTIGFDTALNNIICAVDKIKDTASAHNRIFLVEVMGNNSGSLALNTALTVGAEEVFIPEAKEDFVRFENIIKKAIDAKKSSIIIVSEGDEIGGAKELYDYLKIKDMHQKVRVSVLGHLQRGGAPSFKDRQVATLMGVGAVNQLANGHFNLMLAFSNESVISAKKVQNQEKTNGNQAEMIKILHNLSVF